jgi:DNA segregation ATPase FtsK/SpoIIIE-like protein
MARRKTSRSARPARTRGPVSARAAGVALIALSLLLGVSLVPSQTAEAPRVLAAYLGRAAGSGAIVLPGLSFLIGLTLYVHERFGLSARLWGLLLGYLVTLISLHSRYPAGGEFLAASGRMGGGYLGAVLVVALRRAVGEPGLWAATGLGAVISILLVFGIPVADVLRALLPVLRALAAWTTGSARSGARLLVRILVDAARSSSRAMPALWAYARAAAPRVAAVVSRARGRVPPHATPQLPAQSTDLDPVPATANDGAADAHARRCQAEPSPGVTVTAEAGGMDPPDQDGDDGQHDREEDDSVSASGWEPWSFPEDPDGLQAPAGVRSERAPASQSAASPRGGRGRPGKARGSEGPRPDRAAAAQAYTLPGLSLLDTPSPFGERSMPGDRTGARMRPGKADPEEVARNLERTLASFGVEARVVRWESGPVVTRYELQPAPGVKVQKITSLQNDIALALAASSVRLEAPIPGKSAIGVELPNERPGLVHLREILASDEFRASASPLTVAVGKGIAGNPVVADLVQMPHLLIAGATGAGKSVMLNGMIASILFRSTPEQVRFLMIDPKRVELTNYNGVPHLLSPVVTGPREAAAKLRWAIQEMDSRYGMFAQDGVRNIQSFNAQHPDRPLAYILIIIDELADLMMIAPADFEEIICRLAQMTRATGIHLLVATQRPSVDVITGLIKANIPSRIAFSVTSQVDSRTILDHPGAEKLLGRGDMLFAPIGAVRPTRVQGAFISDAETERLVQFWRAQGEPAYVESLVQASAAAVEEQSADDALLVDAAKLVVRAGYGSVSLLQRKMRIGYVRAARLVDQLEEKGIVGPTQGSNPRDVLVGLEELDQVLRSGAVRQAPEPERVGEDP